MNQLHVRITREPTPEEFDDMGIYSPASKSALAKGAVFGVDERRSSNGRTLVYLCGAPLNQGMMLWVYEEFVEYLPAPLASGSEPGGPQVAHVSN